ncbi:hypothetical protein AHAS_Ahas04G0018800 [Arachis hypogaea]
MHDFFDKYLTCKSSLIQFVYLYNNCLANKEQKELECDAADNKVLIPCVIVYRVLPSRSSSNMSTPTTYFVMFKLNLTKRATVTSLQG